MNNPDRGPPPPASLSPFDKALVDADSSVICGVAPDGRIVYVNGAWARFARANGAPEGPDAWGLGAQWMDAIPECLRDFYRSLFDLAFKTGEVVDHEYDCSSPRRFRVYRMRLLPCDSGVTLVVHSLAHESPHAAESSPPSESRFRAASGIIVQCAHCRRVQCVNEPPRWVRVEAYVEQSPARTSHGLCEACVAHYAAQQSPFSTPAASRVLVVDDDKAIRTLAVRLLRRRGYQVLEASTGDAGIDVVVREPVDLVLTDVTMPEMDGRVMAAAMIAERPQLKVVLMSGFEDLAAVGGRVAGMGFLPKPFTPTTVITAVELALARAS